ncbi:putative inactive poly [ADP-ribose] polymerase SRO3 [Platanthera guangdongensis]|uniref:Inactive poly [ADP-ribose] polymerase SRO3 n=1 Tax=Platanthera guangdongensis TaxID=2320717 RepID=A0ABR2MMY9_9ASPA
MDESSDSESITYDPIADQSEEEHLIHLDEGSENHVNLKHQFLQGIGPLSDRCSVVAIQRFSHRSSAMARAQLESFRLYVKAVAEKNDGNPNLKIGWYTTSDEGVHRILKNGFDSGGIPTGPFGFSLCIHGVFSASNCVLSSFPDANGLRRIILCGVILGKTELVLPGSNQYGPSSEEFDSGVDNLQFPRKYIVWYSDAKTRVLPLYVLVIRLDTQSKGRLKELVERPRSPWISIKLLISALSCSLSSSKICLIKKFHIKYMERKISRLQLVTHLRKVVGDESLISVIRNFQDKHMISAVSTYSTSCERKLSPL